MEINDALLDSWIALDYNVHIDGRRGTGKTTQVTNAFNRNFGTNWRYFSAPTMDPWVDFVGVPEKSKTKNGNDCLELVRPAEFADDLVYGLFFDELNRAKPKVIDAVMELIQFKSINGKKFKNLRVVWCATNPKSHDGDDDETYAVEELDAAHRDRFHIYVKTDYKLNEEYFKQKYPQYADAGISWWNNLAKKDQKLQNKVSPRRLDYALHAFQNGVDMAYVLPENVNVASLANQLISGSFEVRLKKLYKNNNPDEIRKALLNENFYNGVKEDILKNDNYFKVFVPYFPNEKFNSLITTDEKFKNAVFGDKIILASAVDNLMNIVGANKSNPRIVKEIKDKLTEAGLFSQPPINVVVDNHYLEMSEDFLRDEQRKMRITSLLMNEKNIADLGKEYHKKALVIICCVITNSAMAWPAAKIALKLLKESGAKHQMKFKDMMLEASADEQYKKFVKVDKDSKIKDAITEYKLLD